jgi:DNA modification methylase
MPKPRKVKEETASYSTAPAAKPSALLDTRVIYCGGNIEQLKKLPDACVDLISIDPPFNSNRNYEVFWEETKGTRAFVDRHASTQTYIDYMRPRCQELSRVLKKTGSFYTVQVKQKDRAGRPDIQQFAGVMMTHERKKGFFVPFDFSDEAIAEIQQFFKTTGNIIIALTVKDILDEQIARKLAWIILTLYKVKKSKGKKDINDKESNSNWHVECLASTAWC